MHLEELITSVSKDQHGLSYNDINEKDKMKFRPVEKITSEEAVECLRKNIVGSDATVEFLKIISYVMSSFMEDTLTPQERIYRIW